MRPCEEYEALISAFLDGELSEADRAEVAAHLAACPTCQRYFDDLVAMHDAFDQIEDAPVPEGFAEQVMAQVRETPQSEAEKVIFFPHWRRWATLAACCAIVALGLWSARLWVSPNRTANQTAMADSAPPMARDAAVPESEDASDISPLMDEDGVVLPEETPALPEESEAQKRDQATGAAASSLPECAAEIPEPETDASIFVDGHSPEPAMLAPTAVEDQYEPLSGMVTTGGETARVWVENELGLEWEPGRTYLLTEEEYAALLAALEEAGEDFRLEAGEGCWLLAE